VPAPSQAITGIPPAQDLPSGGRVVETDTIGVCRFVPLVVIDGVG
jgi:hypothetical protein